jgi:tripartite-type tricarboxylate transporter receptor subunit TctC
MQDLTTNKKYFATPTRRAALALLTSAAFVRIIPAAAAGVPAAFPRRQLTLVVPFSAGGPVDVLGRLLAQEYSARSGQTAVVENKTGGAGNIGIDMVRKAQPDGTTLLLIPAGNLTINPTFMPDFPLDVERELAPVSLLASAPNVIVVSPKLGVTSIKQLIEKAKTQKLSYGSPGVGSQLHLAMELLKEKTGVDILHVPYRGSPQALSDVIGDHIEVMASNLPAVLTAIQGKLVVPLAMTTRDRSPLVPDVPTLAESGFDGIDVTSWYGMMAPHGIPADIRDAIFSVTREILETPTLQAKLLEQGLNVQIEAPDLLGARIKRESTLWAGVIKSRNIVSK